MSQLFRLGLSAALSSGHSSHTKTFIDAIDTIRRVVSPMSRYQVDFVYADDLATEKGGAEAAKAFVRKGVDAVIGHFSSAAAIGACEIYSRKLITVLLPAASAPMLASSERRVFRICPEDSRQATSILAFIKKNQFVRVRVDGDGSCQAERICRYLLAELMLTGRAASQSDAGDLCIYAGRAESAIGFLRAAGGECPIVFTDDANISVVHQAAQDLKRKVYVARFEYSGAGNSSIKNKIRFPAYFGETIAAAQLCLGPVDFTKFQNGCTATAWRTCIGEVRFKDGENENATVNIRRIGFKNT